VALHQGVLVSPRVIREFRTLYKNDMNRLVRDATRDQKVSELEGEECGQEEYQVVREANQAEDILESLSAKKQTLAQIEYMGKEQSQIMFKIRDSGLTEVAACFPFPNQESITLQDAQTII
jgi:hypothetical protein